MTSLTSQDGKLVVRDGKLGTEQACCCGEGEGDGTGACCECEEFFLVEDQSGGPNTQEGAQAEVDAREAFITEFQALAEENGYTCIRKAVVGGDGQNSYVDCEEEPSEPEFPCIARLAGLYGRCCGTLSEETVSLTEEGPFGQTWTIQICTQDETTRTCVDGLTKAECDERCGDFYANKICQNFDCSNPLP